MFVIFIKRIFFIKFFFSLFFCFLIESGDKSACSFVHDISNFRVYPEMKIQILRYLRSVSGENVGPVNLDFRDSDGKTLLEVALYNFVNLLPRIWCIDNRLIATPINDKKIGDNILVIKSLLEMGANPTLEFSNEKSPLGFIYSYIDNLEFPYHFMYIRRGSPFRSRLKQVRSLLEKYEKRFR